MSCLMIFSNKIKLNIKVQKIFKYLPIILFVVIMLITILYGNKVDIVEEIDELVTGRITYCSNFYEYYGINLFGHEFEFYGLYEINPRLCYLDNAYMYLLIGYGIIPFIIFMYYLTKIMDLGIKNKDMRIFIYLIPFIIYGVMERHIFEIQYNCILIYIGYFVYSKNDYLKILNINEEKNVIKS